LVEAMQAQSRQFKRQNKTQFGEIKQLFVKVDVNKQN
jgi:hypothetical protein